MSDDVSGTEIYTLVRHVAIDWMIMDDSDLIANTTTPREGICVAIMTAHVAALSQMMPRQAWRESCHRRILYYSGE